MAGTGFPNDILTAQAHIVRGYCSRERILYGTGGVIATAHWDFWSALPRLPAIGHTRFWGRISSRVAFSM